MQIIDLVRAYNKEVRWREQGYVPATVEEHLQVSARSGACHLLSCASFVGMGDVAGEEAFEWVCSVPKLVQALCIILRLSDDLKSYEVIIILVFSYNINGSTAPYHKATHSFWY
jgi:(-)-germacrene D synthase